MSNQTQYGVEGDSVRIECVSFSVPKPDYIVWTFGGSEINSFHNQVIELLNLIFVVIPVVMHLCLFLAISNILINVSGQRVDVLTIQATRTCLSHIDF